MPDNPNNWAQALRDLWKRLGVVYILVGAVHNVALHPDLQTFTLGGTAAGTSDWPGWVGKFGIWKTAATDAQIAALQSWLG